jgi:predicted RNA binding protein YcfA (HicA-like mRNA interferase family)
MGRLRPTSRRELLRRLKRLGFNGPYSGGRHEFLIRETGRLILPNPHHGDISVDLLARILQQGLVSIEEWNASE